MSDNNTPIAGQPSDERAVWITPDVATMDAGSAENGSGGRSDDQFNMS